MQDIRDSNVNVATCRFVLRLSRFTVAAVSAQQPGKKAVKCSDPLSFTGNGILKMSQACTLSNEIRGTQNNLSVTVGLFLCVCVSQSELN